MSVNGHRGRGLFERRLIGSISKQSGMVWRFMLAWLYAGLPGLPGRLPARTMAFVPADY